MSIVLGILTFALIVLSLFLVLIVLAQKAKSDGGADTSNVLSKATIYAAIAFFVIAFSLYLGRIYERKHATAAANNALPTIAVPAAPAPAPASAPISVPVPAAAANTPAPEAAKKP